MVRNLVAENWRLERSRYAMVGSKCDDCGKYYFPAKVICISCNSESMQEHLFEGTGKLLEWTKIYEPSRGFEIYAPIYYGIVELEEGIRTSTQLTAIVDENKLKYGMKTQMVFRKLFSDGEQGIVTYGFKAQPIFD